MSRGTGYNRFGNPCRQDKVPGSGDCGRCTGQPRTAAAGSAAGLDAAVDADLHQPVPVEALGEPPADDHELDHDVVAAEPAERVSSLEFASTVRQIQGLAEFAGLDAPAFRAPPKDPNLTRSIRWVTEDDGTRRPIVAIKLRDRTLTQVREDCAAAVVAANPQIPSGERRRVEALLNHAMSPQPNRQHQAEAQLGRIRGRFAPPAAQAS